MKIRQNEKIDDEYLSKRNVRGGPPFSC